MRGVPADMFWLLDQLDRAPGALLGRRVVVTGEWRPAAHGYAASVSRRVMTCCAADAVRVGLDVALESVQSFSPGAVVCVAGVLRSTLREGELRYIIARGRIRRSCAKDRT